jgi:hypothetical protein
LKRYRPDGTLRNPVTIWVIRHGDDLYIRSYRGPDGSWFRRVRVRRDGHIQAGGVDKDVTFADADHDLDDQIDAAYRAKYHRYFSSYVGPMISPRRRGHHDQARTADSGLAGPGCGEEPCAVVVAPGSGLVVPSAGGPALG